MTIQEQVGQFSQAGEAETEVHAIGIHCIAQRPRAHQKPVTTDDKGDATTIGAKRAETATTRGESSKAQNQNCGALPEQQQQYQEAQRRDAQRSK